MFDFFGESLSYVLVVFGLVEFAKKMGVRGQVLTALAAALGLLFGLGYQVAEGGVPQDFAGWFWAAVYGLAVGLTASGAYDFMNARWPRRE